MNASRTASRIGSRSSRSWSPRRSRTPRRGRISRRRGRGSWRRPTRSAGAWFAICTTVRSSASSTRSSRSSWRARRSRTRRTTAPALVTEALDQAERATVELRELAHGILPAVLTRGGLRAGVQALASRMPLPVEIDVSVDRLPAAVEATAYFVVSRGADQRRETLACRPRRGHGARRGRHPAGPRARRRRRAARGPTGAVCWGSPTGSPSSTAGSASRAPPTAARSSPQTSPSAASVRRPAGRFTRFRGAVCGNRAECGNVSAAELIPRGNVAVSACLGWMPAPWRWRPGRRRAGEIGGGGAEPDCCDQRVGRSNPKATLEGGGRDGIVLKTGTAAVSPIALVSYGR